MKFRNMTEANKLIEEAALWWNVIVQLKDGTIVSSYARGNEFNNAMIWFLNAKYLKASSQRDHIIEFVEDPSKTYEEFKEKEEKLKKKYGLK